MDPVEIIKGELKIDWEALKDMSNKTDTPQFKCKKCGISFFNKNYHGNFPLCDKHMLKEVK
tara:strand:- start:9159 stop:9341 length:183 start_codon:yes stop_codon:yes gene_type:complete